MFRAIISPILRSTRLCLQLVVYCRCNAVPRHPDHQQVASSVLYITSCKHSCAPEDGRNYRPKHVELIKTINKMIIVEYLAVYINVYTNFGITRNFQISLQISREIFVR